MTMRSQALLSSLLLMAVAEPVAAQCTGTYAQIVRYWGSNAARIKPCFDIGYNAPAAPLPSHLQGITTTISEQIAKWTAPYPELDVVSNGGSNGVITYVMGSAINESWTLGSDLLATTTPHYLPG